VALTATHTTTYHLAASTAAAIHMHYEGEVVETPLAAFSGIPSLDGIAVLAPRQGVAEMFPADRQDLAALGPVATSIAARGWRVAVVVPAARMGEAHRRLRGVDLHLQAWWDDGDRIRFGGPEVP
jgi:hypothetical protein